MDKELRQSLIWGVGAIIVGVWLWHNLIGPWPWDDFRLMLGHETVPGVIYDAREYGDNDDRGRTQFSNHCWYRYTSKDGVEREARTPSQPGRLDPNLSIPKAISVEYLQDHPGISRIEGEGSQGWWDFLWRTALKVFVLILALSPGVAVIQDGWKKEKGRIAYEEHKTARSKKGSYSR